MTNTNKQGFIEQVGIVTLVLVSFFLIAAIGGMAVVVVRPETLTFQNYLTLMVGLAGSLGLLAVGRGVSKHQPPSVNITAQGGGAGGTPSVTASNGGGNSGTQQSAPDEPSWLAKIDPQPSKGLTAESVNVMSTAVEDSMLHVWALPGETLSLNGPEWVQEHLPEGQHV
jgi:hypothetical protein